MSLCGWSSRLSVCLLIIAAALGERVWAQVSAVGQWSSVAAWPDRAVHATLLPDGRVMFVSYYSESLRPHIWDPKTNTFIATAPAPYELFCAGHTLLPDGRVFLAGGHIADFVGYNRAVVYDPFANTYTPLPNMNKGRWYPTTTVLPSGDVLVTSGDVNGTTHANALPQVFQISSNTWRSLTSAQLVLPLYPLMFVAPNGKVFYAGNSSQSRYLDTAGTGTWSSVANTRFSSRDYGPGVMYDQGKVLIVGGDDPPTATAETIDLTAATPAWSFTGNMHSPRRQHNAVLMPDGKVFIVGGSKGSGFDNSSAPVLPTEMWDPVTGNFTLMASISKYRGYHSIALLLPDGRVLSAGGNVAGANAQVFSPPYLFAGPRPAIVSAPNAGTYGQTVFIGTPDVGTITQVTMVRTGSVTHTFDENQRFLRLQFTQASGGLNVSLPATGNLAPPGYYMLFLLNSAGIPSVAAIIRIEQSAAAVALPTPGPTLGALDWESKQ